MSTAFAPSDFVQLPRLTAAGALGLGAQMLAAAAAEKPYPKPLGKALTTLTAAHTALQSAVVGQFGHGTGESPEDVPAIQELDRILDNCWGGLDDRLQGLLRLPAGTPGAAEAATLRKRLFPSGLAFLKLTYRIQWSESQTRLELIDREGLGASVDELAGKVFLPALRQAHENYGRALGMTEALKQPAGAPRVRGALDAFFGALRTYVVKVLATVEADVPATQSTADALLAPLAAWTPTAKRSGKADAPAGEAPAPEPAAPTGG